jgi:uncharacterized membrane protein YdjX (TVP38/TMEM64 family)
MEKTAKLRKTIRSIDFKFVLFITLIGAAVTLYFAMDLRSYLNVSPSAVPSAGMDPTDARAFQLQEWATRLGTKGLFLYGFLYVLSMTLGLPSAPFLVAAGALWGVTRGFILMLSSAHLGAIIAFLFARVMGRASLQKMDLKTLNYWEQMITQGGAPLILLLRLIPVLPFNLINYAAGLSSLPLHRFVLGNAAPFVPLVFLQVLLGSAALQIRWSDPGTWQRKEVMIPLLVNLALFLIGTWATRRHQKRHAPQASGGR